MATNRLTDNDNAVIIDSLSFMREKIEADAPIGTPTTNIDSALSKVSSLIDPATTQLFLSNDDPVEIITELNRLVGLNESGLDNYGWDRIYALQARARAFVDGHE